MDYEPTGPASSVVHQQLPTCDTYFVESMDQDDDGVFVAQRWSKQELARIHADTQMDLAEDLSRAVSEEYQEDILDHMEYMEVCTLVFSTLVLLT
jgi:hypothetical protein